MKWRKDIHLGEYKMLGYQNSQGISYYLKIFTFPWWDQGQTRHDIKCLIVQLQALWAAIWNETTVQG